MTTQAAHVNGTEKLHIKDVWYAGSDQLQVGHFVCYDRDYGTAATRDLGRAWQVEKPSATNIHHGGGIVVKANVGAAAGIIKIAEPIGKCLVDVWTSANCTIDATDLFVTPASYVLASTGAKRVARAMQTVDRSSTNGKVLARLYDWKEADIVSARSRTAVRLPTAAIWNNFPLAEMRSNPFFGSLLDTDFTQGCPAFIGYADATYAASAAGKTPTEHIFINTGATGELGLFATTDNQAAELQFPIPIKTTGAGNWAFEARIKRSVITDSKFGFFAGLMVPSKLVGDLIVDAGTLQTEGSVGFFALEGDGDAIDVYYDKTGQNANEHAADWATVAADTYNTVGLYYNGSTIAMYLDGVATGTAISAVDIAAADFPSATVMVPTLALKNAHADDATVTIDWIRVAQFPS